MKSPLAMRMVAAWQLELIEQISLGLGHIIFHLNAVVCDEIHIS